MALKTKSLQLIVDVALFKPGLWKPSDFSDRMTDIPEVNEYKFHMLLSTPIGTLFNEIVKSMHVLVSCIVKILDQAVDMDVGN